jgi:hypothetical protein
MVQITVASLAYDIIRSTANCGSGTSSTQTCTKLRNTLYIIPDNVIKIINLLQ